MEWYTITMQVPAQKTGWYLLTCTLENGANTARAPVYFADTEIVQKHLTDGRTMWQVLDAKSGQPLANEKVEFFCWSSRWDPTSKREESDHSRFAEMTDDEGKPIALVENACIPPIGAEALAELYPGQPERESERLREHR